MTSDEVPHRPVPDLEVSRWFNTSEPLGFDLLRGRVVVIEAFQMLCPACVAYGLPQAVRVHEVFGTDVTVLGLHTVFEHHDAMRPVALEAFIAEYRIPFPVGVDSHEPGVDAPSTMRRLALRGTPSLVLVDRAGRIRLTAFGRHDDLSLGAAIARLVDEPTPAAAPPRPDARRPASPPSGPASAGPACDPADGCTVSTHPGGNPT